MARFEPDPAQVTQLAARLDAENRRRPGRVLSLLHVPTGGCGGCGLGLEALDAPPFEMEALGLRFVTTPRHADTLLVTGPLARNALGPLMRAWEAMPVPRYVVAIGDCAASAAPLGEPGYALTPGGVRGALPLDLVIRGRPPPPRAVLLGLVTLRAAAER